MSGSFFAGFAKRMSENLRGDAERTRAEEEKIKQFQLDRLIEISQRPDLRDEEKAPLLSQIITLAGAKAGKGSKKKPGFEDMIGNVLSIFDKPTAAQPAAGSETEELQSMLGIGQGGGMRPREVSPYLTPPIAGGDIPGIVPELSQLTNLPQMPQRGPFYSAEELRQRKLQDLEATAQLQQKYSAKAYEPTAWRPIGEATVDAFGQRVQREYNPLLNQVRDVPLPIGETVSEMKARTAAEARKRANPSADRAFRKIDERAAELAAAANPGNPAAAKDPAIRERYFPVAAEELIASDALSAQAATAGIEYRRAGTASLQANLPKTGEPTAAGQRVFTQISKQISEIEGRIKTLSSKGNIAAAVGQRLRDGTVIEAPGDTGTDVDRFIKQREQLLRELNDDLLRLKRQRSGAAVEESVPERTPGQKAREKSGAAVPKRDNREERYGEPRLEGDIFFRGSVKYRLGKYNPDTGRFAVERVK